jgi:predicted component of type VI protein secretion system
MTSSVNRLTPELGRKTMAVNLIVLSGVHEGRWIPIAVPEFLIGRDPSCHLRPASKSVQRQHCAIVSKGGRFFLRDQTGTEGTLLNRRLLVGGEMQLANGDHIVVGPLLFQVAIERETPAAIPNHAGGDAPQAEAGSDTFSQKEPKASVLNPPRPRPQTPPDAEEALYL